MAVSFRSRRASRLPILCLFVLFAGFVWSISAHTHEESSGSHEEGHSHHQHAKMNSQQNLWLYALASTALISAAPFFILFFIPLHDAHEHSSLLKVLLGFAAGGLLGDAFLHLIPHALSPHDHHHGDENPHHHHHHHHEHGSEGHDHDHSAEMLVGLYVLSGIMIFMAVEKVVRILKGGEHHHHHVPSPPEEKSSAVKEMGEDDSELRRRVKSGQQSEEVASKEKKETAKSNFLFVLFCSTTPILVSVVCLFNRGLILQHFMHWM